MSESAPLCDVCGEVIGVYEPLIVLREGGRLETSRAAAHDGQLCGELYHRACYPLRGVRLDESRVLTEPAEPSNGHVGQPDGAGDKESRQ